MTVAEGEIIDRMYGALANRDLDGAMACLAPGARVWHCFDGIAQDRAAILAGWTALLAGFSDFAFVDVRRHAIAGGFVQQQMMTGRTPSGALVAWAICLVVRLENGLVARVEEYIDRASRFSVADLHAATTPGL
jgi:ketosteroid isomerase-like protein